MLALPLVLIRTGSRGTDVLLHAQGLGGAVERQVASTWLDWRRRHDGSQLPGEVVHSQITEVYPITPAFVAVVYVPAHGPIRVQTPGVRADVARRGYFVMATSHPSKPLVVGPPLLFRLVGVQRAGWYSYENDWEVWSFLAGFSDQLRHEVVRLVLMWLLAGSVVPVVRIDGSKPVQRPPVQIVCASHEADPADAFQGDLLIYDLLGKEAKGGASERGQAELVVVFLGLPG